MLCNVSMKTIDDVRHANLLFLIDKYGGNQRLADATGIAVAQISQWKTGARDSKTGKPRVMSGASARKMEKALDYGSGWMDVFHAPEPTNELKMQPDLDGHDADTPVDDHEFELPLYDEIKLSGGLGREATYVGDTGRKIRFLKESLQDAGVFRRNAIAVKVTGHRCLPGPCPGLPPARSRRCVQLQLRCS